MVMAAVLTCATLSVAGGSGDGTPVIPGDILVDMKCFNTQTGGYCGTFSMDAEIRKDNRLSLNCYEAIRGCTTFYPSRCPLGSVRSEYRYTQGSTSWSGNCPQ